MKKYISLFLFILLACAVNGQRTKNVCGETDYVVPETQTLAEAKRTAIARARIQALADEFGTIVTQTNTTAMHNVNGQSNSTFNSFSENDVRGVWVEDTKEPEMKISYKNDMMVIHAKVCGKARELKTAPVELEIQTLSYGYHNGESHPFRPPYATTQFNDGDFYGVRFRSPVNGYVAIFLREDNTGTIVTQLPYEGSNGYAREVKNGKEYVFMNNNDPEYSYNSSAILQTNYKIENNTLIVVFSKKAFHLSLPDSSEAVPMRFPEIELPKFQKWLHGLRAHDESVQVQEIVLTIQK